MQKLQTFWYVLSKTLTEPEYYRDIVVSKLSFSFKYFFLFFLLLTTLNTVVYRVKILPKMQEFVSQTKTDISANFPQDLVLTFTPGTLEVNDYPTPITIPFSDITEPIFNSSEDYDFAVTIAPESEVPINNSLITLTKNNLVYRAVDDTKESISYARLLEDEPVVIDRDRVNRDLNELVPALETIMQWSPIFFFVSVLIMAPFSALILTAIYSFLVYTILSLTKHKLPYKKVFQIGLHAITFSETAGFLQSLIISGTTWNYLYPISFFGVMGLALYAILKKK